MVDATDTAVAQEGMHSLMDVLDDMTPESVLKVILLAVVLVILVELFTRILNRFLSRSKLEKSLHGFLRTAIRVMLYFLAAIIVASSLDIDVTSLIALFSVIGLAASLALQGALTNLASGIVILTTKPFKVGDYICINDSEGFVEEITMNYTKLVAYDKRMFFIPNSTVTSGTVINYTHNGWRRIEINVSASYDCGVDEVKAAIAEAVAAVPTIVSDPAPSIRLKEYGESAITYGAWVWCTMDNYWDTNFGLLEEIKRSFDRNGIMMTYPHLNVHMVQPSVSPVS